MAPSIITFKTAKLAKKLGFTREEVGDTERCYSSTGSLEKNNGASNRYLAPTKAKLQNWVRSKHHIDICPHPLITSRKEHVNYAVYHIDWNKPPHPNFITVGDKKGTFKQFGTYGAALEAGLKRALKTILNN